MIEIKIGKLLIQNHSDIITNKELYQCLQLLPKEYTEIENCKIYILKDRKGYIKFCLRNKKLIELEFGALTSINHIIGKGCILAFFLGAKNEIYVLQNRIKIFLKGIKTGFMKTENAKYITKEVWEKYESMWIKYIVVNSLCHEIVHALQKNKGNMDSGFKKIFIRWKNNNREIDAVVKCKEIFNTYGEQFCEILGVEGIKAVSEINPLRVTYEYHMLLERKD